MNQSCSRCRYHSVPHHIKSFHITPHQIMSYHIISYGSRCWVGVQISNFATHTRRQLHMNGVHRGQRSMACTLEDVCTRIGFKRVQQKAKSKNRQQYEQHRHGGNKLTASPYFRITVSHQSHHTHYTTPHHITTHHITSGTPSLQVNYYYIITCWPSSSSCTPSSSP